MAVRAPQRLNSSHILGAFDSGEPVLDTWLREQALASARTASTYVVTDVNDNVLAYYCLSAGALLRRHVPGRAQGRRGLPDPIPVILLGRLAVDRAHQGRGIGADMLQDALLRALDSSRRVAAFGLLVHALDERSLLFYQRWGFVPCRDHPRSLLLPLTL